MNDDANPFGDAAPAAPVGDIPPPAAEDQVAPDPVAAAASAAPVDAEVMVPHAITRQEHEAGITAEIEAVWQWATGQARASAIRDQALVAAAVMRRAMRIPAVMEHLVRLRHHVMTEGMSEDDPAP